MASNLHRVFRARDDGFINQIKPTLEQRDYLNSCRQKVRACLKNGMASFIEEVGGNSDIVKPKFRLQGSWAYGTCNQPAYPDQEMDVDYGVYLPNKILSNGRSDMVAKAYFKAVEALLRPLADKEGWELVTEKDTCCRLTLKFQSHMDVPLYIVPDEMFDDLIEQNNMVMDSLSTTAGLNEDYVFKGYHLALENFRAEAKLIRLDKITKIHMALRDGNWKASDCELIRKWYAEQLDQQEDNGRQLRYIARYLKAWRDFVYQDGGGPSSILLMVVANQQYKYIQDRDDLALLEVLKKLPNALLGSVYEPNIPEHSDEDFNRIPKDKRQEAYNLAMEIYQAVDMAQQIESPSTSIRMLKGEFGSRIPANNDYVSVSGNEPPQAAIEPAFIQPNHGG